VTIGAPISARAEEPGSRPRGGAAATLTYTNDKSSPLNAYPAFWGPFSVIGEGAEMRGTADIVNLHLVGKGRR
jgi:hypothetical protein